MAVLSRVSWSSQQRFDLQHVLATESFFAADFRHSLKILNGLTSNYVIRGLEVSSTSALTVNVSVADCVILTPLDNTTSFYVGLSTDPVEQVSVPASSAAVFIEAFFERDTRTPVTTAFWDPGAIASDTPAGAEFTAALDFENTLVLKFRANTTGFTPGSIPVTQVATNSSGVTAIEDARDMFFRLGRGGANPDPYSKFAWSNTREEPLISSSPSYLGQSTTSNPYFAQDGVGAKNDKAITSMKSWMDAIMTALAEMKGTSLWYASVGNQTTPNVLFHTGNGHSFVPSSATTLQWSKASDGKLRSDGAGPLSWASSFGSVVWNLGGTFTSSLNRTFATNLFEVAVTDGRSLYLRVEREATPPGSSGNNVEWGSISVGGQAINQSISGQAKDFTGIAIGDYVRKPSDSYFKYYKVVGFYDSSYVTTAGLIATDAVTGIVVSGTLTASTEPIKWFRENYRQTDLYVSSADGLTATSSDSSSTLSVDDINMIWLGRRSGTLFNMRDYGILQAGEEVTAINDSDDAKQVGGSQGLYLRHNLGAAIDISGDYDSLNANLITIQKRKTDNYIDSGSSNVNAWLSFTIDSATLAFTADGDGLWARLSDSTSAALTAGTISSGTANVYQIISSTSNPLSNYDNKNVYLLARRVTINGQIALQFLDGSIISEDGWFIPKDVSSVVVGVTTSTSATTTVNHAFLRNSNRFVWNAVETSSTRHVVIGALQTSTGLTLDATPSGAVSLDITFVRHVS